MRAFRWFVACAAVAVWSAGALPGQTHERASGGLVRDTAGPQYKAGALRRAILGSNWRHLWVSPVDVPVLDLQGFGGGLSAVREGGNQSRTLHFNGGDGRRYVFRTAAKRLAPRFNDELLGTPIGGIVEDQFSTLHPAGLLMAHVLEDAAGVLHPEPQLVKLPDDARLGAFRESFAHQLGYIAERPDNVPEGVAAFAGAHRFVGADGLLDHLDASSTWRLDARAWLTARLLDGILGDFDRGADQWEFACHDRDGRHTCRPIARDRDWAFMRANGLVMRLLRASAPRIGLFDDPRVAIRSLTAMTVEFDRSHLVDLPWATWEAVATAMTSRLSNEVLAEAVRAQPASYQSEATTHLLETSLRTRRDALLSMARELYALVNTQADIFGTDSSDVAEIARASDGSVRVILRDTGNSTTFDRTFVPGETREIRVYLQDGDDRAIVHGSADRSIPVRLIGGAGNDVLIDSSRVARGGASTVIHDASGDNRIVRGRNTRVDARSYLTAQPRKLEPDSGEGPAQRLVQEERRGRFEDQRPGSSGGSVGLPESAVRSDRSWGHRTTLQPAFDYKDGAGIIIGAALTDTVHAFRKNPYARKVGARVFYALGSRGVGAQLDGDWRSANAPYAVIARVRGTQFESQRFYLYGNDTPQLPSREARIIRDEVSANVALRWSLGATSHFAVGPGVRWVRPHTLPHAPAPALPARGSGFGAAAGMAIFEHTNLDRSAARHQGYRVSLAAASYAKAWDAESAFGATSGELAGYLPLSAATLALRVGGRRVWGDFPVHEAAMLGGRSTLRGHEWNRFAGDAMAYGNSELRVPVTRVELLARGDLGLILLADAGRVWVDGDSPGDWHTAAGAGLSFQTLSRGVSVVYARGEVARVYAYMGFPF